jgi:hypothetical protein
MLINDEYYRVCERKRERERERERERGGRGRGEGEERERDRERERGEREEFTASVCKSEANIILAFVTHVHLYVKLICSAVFNK